MTLNTSIRALRLLPLAALLLSLGQPALAATTTAMEDMIRTADRALLDAKRAGRNRVHADGLDVTRVAAPASPPHRAVYE